MFARAGITVRLSWAPSVSQDVVAYDIYRSSTSGVGSAVKIGSFSGQVGPQMPPVFIDWGTGAPPDGDIPIGAAYYYWIVARDSLGNPANSGGLPSSISVPAIPVLGTTLTVADTAPPAIPSPAVLSSAVDNQMITVNWSGSAIDPKTATAVGGNSNPIAALGGYLVFRDDDLTEVYAMTLLNTTTWSNLGLGWGETHSYSLRAFDGQLNMSSLYGPASATTALAPTYDLKVSTLGACTVTITNRSSQDILTGCPKTMTANSNFTWVVTPGDYDIKSVSGPRPSTRLSR